MADKKTLQEKLDSFGVPCRVFGTKGRIFRMENYAKRDRVKIYKPANVDVKVFGKKSVQQAVLVFNEPETVEEQGVLISFYGKLSDTNEFFDVENKEFLGKVEKARMSVQGSTFKVTDISKSEASSRYVTIEVTMPPRENCFLIGVDEDKTFICQLLNTVNSVSAAHEALRPEVSDDAVRVGEWFFDPLSDEEATDILSDHDSYMGSYEEASPWYCGENTVSSDCCDEELIMVSDIYSDNHKASFIFNYKNDIYVMGLITDDRKTHSPVLLNGLHRVKRNMELVNDSDKWD